MASYITTSATILTEFTSSIIPNSVNHTQFAAVAAAAGVSLPSESEHTSRPCQPACDCQPVNTVITAVSRSEGQCPTVNQWQLEWHCIA